MNRWRNSCSANATYGWNIGPKEDVMCVGVAEIREIALGLEMAGLQGWTYPYQRVVIDEKIGEVVGFCKQVATDADGSSREIYGIGGSWFRLAAAEKERIQRGMSGEKLPGDYPLGQAPVPIW